MSWPISAGSTCGSARCTSSSVREDQQGRQRHQDPRPRPQRVVRDVEPQRGAEGVALVARREHALGDVAAAAGLRAGIPGRPPLHGQRDHEQRHLDGGVVEVRQQREGARIEPFDQAGQAADLGPRARRRRPPPITPTMAIDELHQVRGEHAPQPAQAGEADVDRRADQHRRRRGPSPAARWRS